YLRKQPSRAGSFGAHGLPGQRGDHSRRWHGAGTAAGGSGEEVSSEGAGQDRRRQKEGCRTSGHVVPLVPLPAGEVWSGFGGRMTGCGADCFRVTCVSLVFCVVSRLPDLATFLNFEEFPCIN